MKMIQIPAVFLFILVATIVRGQEPSLEPEVMDKLSSAMKAKEYNSAKLLLKDVFTEYESNGDHPGLARCALHLGRVYAHARNIDSSLIWYGVAATYATKANLEYEMKYAYSGIAAISGMKGDHAQSIRYNKLIIDEALKNEQPVTYSSRLFQIGSSYLSLPEYDSAAHYLTQVIDIKERIGDARQLPRAYHRMGQLHQQRNEYGKAASIYLKAIEANDAYKSDQTKRAEFLSSLADVLTLDGQYYKAKEYADESLRLMDSLGFNFYRASVLTSLAKIAEADNNLKDAEDKLKEALDLYEEAKIDGEILEHYHLLSSLYHDQDRLVECESYLNKGLELLKKVNNPKMKLRFNLLHAQLLISQSRKSTARRVLRQVVADARESEEGQIQQKGGLMLAGLNADSRDYAEAYNLLLDSYQLKESLEEGKQRVMLARLETEYNRSQKEQEITSLNFANDLKDEQLANRQRLVIFLIVGALLTLIAAIAGFLLFNAKRKNSLVLAEKNKVIQTALDEKDLLLREIHHRVKNNLQVISSLLALQGRYSDDPLIEDAIRESKDRVKSMSLIHQNLYQKENLTGVEIKDYFEKLFRSLFNSYNIQPERVHLITEIDSINLDVDTVVPIGLIVNELVSNALKYAFPEDVRGTVTVSLNETDGKLRLSVRDNGVGMDPTKDSSGSFGYELIDSFKNKLKADLDIANNEGTHVQMTIGNYKKVA